MAKNIKKEIKKNKNFSYLQRDFKSFRDELVSYAREHYSEKTTDFSEASLAGMFIDLAAYVGDTMSFYLDHQFNETFLDTAIEPINIENLVRLNGVKIRGPSPSSAFIDVTIRVPATTVNGEKVPNPNYLPVIQSNTTLSSNFGIKFYLIDDLDFSKKDINGNYTFEIENGNMLNNGEILDFLLTKTGYFTSGKTYTEELEIGNEKERFRKIVLEKDNINEIISVVDSEGDLYYEVDFLSQDTVFKRLPNTRSDSNSVPERLQIIHAPKRFVATRSYTSGKITLRFGGGDEELFDSDIIPDPSEHAIQLYGDRKNFNKVAIDPNQFLETSTLGIMPRNTNLTITYRYGGGLADNVPAGDITAVNILFTKFKDNVPFNVASDIRDSMTVFNPRDSFGGENEPSLDDLKISAIFGKTTQNRIVTREDLLANIYTMPSNLGRVFRASIANNPNNPLAARVFILSRDRDGKLIVSHDTLKENLAIYLNKFRIISDAIDIIDGIVINFKINYSVTIESHMRPTSVLQKINTSLKEYFKIENFQIDQPVITGEVENIILNTPGVQSIESLKFTNIHGVYEGNSYSNNSFSFAGNIDRGMIFPPAGGIFELKFPNDNIVGKVV